MYAVRFVNSWLMNVNRTKLGKVRSLVWTEVPYNAKAFRLRLMAMAQVAELHREVGISARVVRHPYQREGKVKDRPPPNRTAI